MFFRKLVSSWCVVQGKESYRPYIHAWTGLYFYRRSLKQWFWVWQNNRKVYSTDRWDIPVYMSAMPVLVQTHSLRCDGWRYRNSQRIFQNRLLCLYKFRRNNWIEGIRERLDSVFSYWPALRGPVEMEHVLGSSHSLDVDLDVA